jgi:hypothetical protein
MGAVQVRASDAPGAGTVRIAVVGSRRDLYDVPSARYIEAVTGRTITLETATDHCGPFPGDVRVTEGSDAIEIHFAPSTEPASCTAVLTAPTVTEDDLHLRFPVGERVIATYVQDMFRTVKGPFP